jgi:putative aldouronate transport system permease protein
MARSAATQIGVKAVGRARSYRLYYILALPGLLYFFVFHYLPIVGIVIAFKDISPFNGIVDVFRKPFVGLKWFRQFFESYYFWQIMRNTLVISFLKLVSVFPASIILALLINELRSLRLKKVVQSISYIPHFFSMVVVAGIVMSLLTTEGGLVNQAIAALGGTPVMFLGEPRYFRTILVVTTLWQEVGWGTIIFLAAISGVDPQLYEAAIIDGAGRWRQTLRITIPSITFVVVIMLIFRIGGLLNAGFEQILLLYSAQVYEVSDIIDTYVYRSGIQSMQYSFATAVGLFKAGVAAALLLSANFVSKRLGHTGIW